MTPLSGKVAEVTGGGTGIGRAIAHGSGEPIDIAELALFPASGESSWMTGTAIPLEDGLSAY